jgi:hypothetical protein
MLFKVVRQNTLERTLFVVALIINILLSHLQYIKSLKDLSFSFVTIFFKNIGHVEQ